MKSIAIIVQNVIQWYAIRPLVFFLNKQPGISTDIFVFAPDQMSQDFKNIADSLSRTIIKDGFKIKKTPKAEGYQVGLAPYSNMFSFPCKYKLGFCYGAATTKPSFTLQPSAKMGFHGLFVHDIYGKEVFSVYGKTYVVPYLYLKEIPHAQKPSTKPVILYLPTYNEPSVLPTIEALQKIKNDFYIITKGHHGIDHLNHEKNKKDLLAEIADEHYDSEQYIAPLLAKADVVLSDNSGAVMDALYAKVPVAIVAPEINAKFENIINTLQFELVENNVIPYSKESSPTSIKRIIEEALSEKVIERQSKASDALFPVKNGGPEAWFTIIKQYLDDGISQNYCHLHDYLVDLHYNADEKISVLEQENASLHSSLSEIQKRLAIYEDSRAHRSLEKLLSPRRKK